MKYKWLRTCQECGNKQEDTNPTTMGPDARVRFDDRMCKACHSLALDYGKVVEEE